MQQRQNQNRIFGKLKSTDDVNADDIESMFVLKNVRKKSKKHD